METAVEVPAVPDAAPPPAYPAHRRAELILDALRTALRDPADHRLYQYGKLPGLFAARHGAPADAARSALADGFLEVVRTEEKGRQIVEWVRATPRAVRFVDAHDSPKAVLSDLLRVIGDTRAAVPAWMAEAAAAVTALATSFDARAKEMTAHLDELTKRVEAALRRADVANTQDTANVPWGMAALEYLDRRAFAGVPGDCPLAELFRALTDPFPALALPEFHVGVRRLHDARAVRLVPSANTASDAEFAVILGAEVCTAVRR